MGPRRSPTDRDQARAALVDFLDRHFTMDEFDELLRAIDLDEVVEAIPGLTVERDYLGELVHALDRRGRLDAALCAALAEHTREHVEVAQIAAGLGIELTPALAPDAITELVELLRQDPLDAPGQLFSLAYGSPHHALLRGGPEDETMSTAVQRLADSVDPEALAALGWLAGRIHDTVSQGPLGAAAAAVVLMTGQTADEEPLAEQLTAGRELTSPGPESMLPVQFLAGGVAAAAGVVAVHGSESVISTGWLITNSLVIVPAHAFSRTLFRRSPDDDAVWVRPGYDRAGDPVRLLPAERELMDKRLDLAVLRLREPVDGVTPLRVRPESAPPGDRPIALIHHFNGQPKQVSMHHGRVLRNDGHELVYQAASGPGTGGAPVFDEDWRVIGTHRAWRGLRVDGATVRVKCGTATPALLNWLRSAGPADGRLWREIVAAQPDLRSVDSALRRALTPTASDPAPRAPMLIKTVDPDHTLDGVADLRVDSRMGSLVSATGTLASLERLLDDPGVLAVEASTPGGVPECWRSVPHVWGDPAQNLGVRAVDGTGALVAVIDNGLDVLHEAFRDVDGKTRIAAFWDQRCAQVPDDPNAVALTMSEPGRAAAARHGLRQGALYVREDIQGFIDGRPLPAHFPNRTDMAHGTVVASIAAGRCTGPDENLHFGGGVAPAATIVAVRPDSEDRSIGYAKGYMDALTFIDKIAEELGLPVVVNISAGMNLGAHDGSSDVEAACEVFLNVGKKPGRAIVKSAGNELDQARHAELDLPGGAQATLSWTTKRQPNRNPDATDLLELWFAGDNAYTFALHAPGAAPVPAADTSDPALANAHEQLPNGNRFTVDYKRSAEDNASGRLRIEISRGEAMEIEEGTWQLVITTVQELEGKPIRAWIERSAHRTAAFTSYIETGSTLTIPGTAPHVITVGAAEVHQFMRMYPSSSLGPTLGSAGCEKPVVVAPGVAIRAARAGTATELAPADDGTSYAAPHVTGAIALVFSQNAAAGKPQPNAVQLEKSLKRTVRGASLQNRPRYNNAMGFGQLNIRQLLADQP